MSILKKPNELEISTLFKGLVYGQPGSGKTTLALSAKNPVLIDFDKGLNRVQPRFRKDSLQVDKFQQVLDLIDSGELDVFDTIVVDTMGKLIDRIGEYVMLKDGKFKQKSGQLTMQGWGQVKIEWGNFLKKILLKNKSVIFVAHESEEKDGEDTKKRPDVSGSSRKDIIKELDFLGYMEIVGDKRTISFTPNEKYYAKNSVGLDGLIEIPDTDKVGHNTFVQDKIEKAIADRRVSDNELNEKYNILKGIIDEKINIITSENVNDIYNEIVSLEVIWDSKIYAWNKLQEKAKTIGAAFNRTTLKFE